MKLISVVTPCYNENENIHEVYQRVKVVFDSLPEYQYEHIFIDNASKDNTVALLRELAQKDPNVKVIVNSRNFGAMNSHFYAMLQAKGDAIMSIVADLQDPPELIPEFIKIWEQGNKIVVGVKPQAKESWMMFTVRKTYYKVLSKLSEHQLIDNYTGFGLYDKQIIDILKTLDDQAPYFRGIIATLGFNPVQIPYVQPLRHAGTSKHSFGMLYDGAMRGLTAHSKLPLRLMTVVGFAFSSLSFLSAMIYFGLKLYYWDQFSIGIAPVVIGLFLFSSLQLFFLGLIGEYIATIHGQVMKQPLVIEEERINFDSDERNSKV